MERKLNEEKSSKKNLNLSIYMSPYFEYKRAVSDFFDVSCLELAKNLLGSILVRKLEDGTILKAKIVETECYPGGEDKASYSYNGKRTPRNEPMYMKPGTAFVYKTYGMYHCFNISSKGDGAAVLLRSAEPITGLERMYVNRTTYHQRRRAKLGLNDSLPSKKTRKELLQAHEMCNGPSKLCISFDITSENCNKEDLSLSNHIWIEERCDIILESNIIKSTRIGIDSAGPEWSSKLFRFYVKNNQNVSKRDKKRENEGEPDVC